MCIQLKERMGMEKMLAREKEMLKQIFHRFEKINGVEILGTNKDRLGVISFIVKNAHYNRIVRY